MGDKPGELQFVQRVIHRRRNREIGELHQQVILLVDCVFLRILLKVLQIFVTQVEIAAGRQSQAGANSRLQLIAALADQFGIEFIV